MTQEEQKLPKINKYDRFMLSALDKMFAAVGFEKFDREFTNQSEWYTKREWTEEEEREYREWFVNECRSKLRMNKKAANTEAGYFLLQFGWKTKYIGEDKKIIKNEKSKEA